MVKCLNCEEDVPKYMTQEVNLETFPSLEEKAKKLGYTEYRVCEECYDKLAATLDTASGTYFHPYLGRTNKSDVKE